MSDFNDRPLVAGSVVGLRAFKVDKLARLTGCVVETVFRPGVNEAECRKDLVANMGGAWPAIQMLQALTGQMTNAYPLSTSANTPVTPVATRSFPGCDCPACKGAFAYTPPAQRTEHTVGGMNCTCGFYAYFDNSNEYYKPGMVVGVIEGTGVCTVGTRGFRAARAELKALILPPAGPLETWEFNDRSSGVEFGASGTKSDLAVRALMPRLRSNYADIPAFHSIRDAVAEFPLTPGEIETPNFPTPESDPNFWSLP